MASASTNLLRSKYRSATPVTNTTTANTSPTIGGGFANGIGYTVGKLGTGALSILEGIWDYTAGGIADLFGADAWAEQQFANNVTGDLNNRLDTWYNPSGGWQIVGDVASGVGNTLAGVGITALATVISGGTLTPYAAGITAGAMGLGAAGMGTSEAYAKTGELGLKEYGYGAITGATEGLLEKATGGASKIASRVFAKNTAKTLAKQTVLKGIIKNMGSDFAGEFFEEAVSEFITPYYQRWTKVDPNAEKATIQQIGYAGLVGGIAGALTGGTTNVIQEATRGGTIAKNAEYTKYVVDTARQFAEYEDRNKTGRKPYETIKSLLTQYESINNTGKPTAEQKKLLAKMDRQNVALTYEPEVQNSRNKIIAQADALAQRLNDLGYKDENGKPYNFKNGADLLKNETLVMQLAVQDAMANVLTATETFDMATALNVDNITEQAFDRFKSEGMTQQKKALMELTGIDIDNTSYADFVAKMKAIEPQVMETAQKAMQMRITGKQAISNARQREERLKENIQALTDETIKGIKDGNNVFRTANGQDIAVIKEGDTYFVWDGKNISRPLTLEETVGALNEIKGVNLATESGQNQTETPKTEQPTATQETTQENENKGQEQATEEESKTEQEKTEEKTEEETLKAESKEEGKEESKPKKPRKKPTPKKSKEQLEKERKYALAKDFVAKLRGQGGWYAKDVFNYVAEHPELNFIERIFEKDDTAKQDLANFLDAIDDISTLEGLKHYMSGAYGDKGRTWDRKTFKATYPYRGAVRTFQNAISRREQAIGTGTNLGIKNGIVTFAEVESLFDKLNSNRELAQLAKRVFATAKKLGVNIRFVNQTFAKDQVAGDNVGDMVEYKTSYFNDTTVTDQHKASTIVHEMIHACTVYVMSDESVVGDPKLREIRRRFNEIYDEIKYDKDFSNEYGISNAKEMVAELANEAFVFKMKKKTIWEKIVDAICELFGFKRGTSAYDNAMACLDYLLDNPDIKSYREYAQEQRRRLRAQGDAPFGELAKMTDTQVRDGIAKAHEISRNLAYKDQHKKDLEKHYNSEESTVALDTLIKRYNKILDIWEKIGGELNSDFLNEWNSKVGKDRSFTVFKAQSGYKYNIELSTMCKKGVPLFEAIDTIVKKEVMKELGVKELGKAEKEILYDILKGHHFEIPCAICYVEQARQREGKIIKDFLDGKIDTNSKGNILKKKLGWNEVLKMLEVEMRKQGVEYTFPFLDRSVATDAYTPKALAMDKKTQTVFYNALIQITNEEIERSNKNAKTQKPLLKDATPSSLDTIFKGKRTENLAALEVLFKDPDSRFFIDEDLLYSSITTLNLAKTHQRLYSAFNAQQGQKGYKTKQTPVVYWGDILGKTYKPKDTRREGGIRNQSNSDSQAYTLLDKVQMYLDFTAKGYYLQAYTKVLFDLKLFGLSNGKQNASLIPRVVEYRNENGEVDIEKTMDTAGLDKKGNPIYDDIEGIPHEEAFMLIEDAEYSKTITGICIGYSDKHIFKLLDDSRVQLIIGYNDKSNDLTKRYRGAKYSKNYNNENEATYVKAGGSVGTVHIGFNQFVQKAERMFKYNAETGESATKLLYHNGKMYKVDDIPNLASALYLEYCQEKGYTPAYNTFKDHPNYYKLLADFGLKDSKGHYAPHKKVAYNMPDKVPYLDSNGKKQYMDTEEYIKAELKKEMAVRDSISEALADDSKDGIIPQFKEAVKKHRAEISKAKAPTKTALKSEDVDLIFDEEFYKQFKNESKEKITESLEELQKLKASDKFKDLSFEESYDINAKISALKAGYSTLYDYYVGREKKRLTADFEYSVKTGNPTYASSIVEKKKAEKIKANQLKQDIAESTPHKNAQYEIIQRTNPMFNDTSVGIRSPKDIHTFAEVINDGESFNWGDFSKEDAKKALKSGKIRVYSSYPIKNGVFVSTSYQQALDYAGSDPSKVHSRVVALDSVAWINGDEGQYAKVYSAKTVDISKRKGYSYSRRNPNTVTESEFYHHYWASANNILSGDEIGLLDSSIGKIKAGDQYNQNSDGLYMIPVGENGVLNKIVLTDGNYGYYSIDSIIEIDLYNETDLEIERRLIYASERRGVWAQTRGIVRRYYAKDFKFNVFRKKLAQNIQNSNGKQNGSGNSQGVRNNGRRLSGLDKDYLALVKYGHLKSAQRMVEEQAQKAGYTVEQAQAMETILYDDKGDIIPLSKRFNVKKAEISNAIKGSDKIMTELPNDKITIQEVITGKATGKELIEQEKASVTEKGEASKVLMTNAQAGVERVLKEGGTENAEAKVNFVRAGRASALNAIDKDGGQYNLDGTKRLGASLGNILMPIYSANAMDGKTYADFELYLLHWHNTDRYLMGKPVFNDLTDSDPITDKDSWEAIAELDKQYPMFRKIAEQVWKYNDNNLQIALEGGVYTQEYVNELREMYPHYVPTFREEYSTKANAIQGKNNLRLNNAKKKAVGSSAKILPIDEMMATQTIQKITTARINNLLVTMLNNGNNADFQVISSEDANVDVDKDTEITFHADKDKNKYQITFYHEGKMVTARVSWSVYKGIESFQGNSELNDNLALNALAKANTLFKKMVTSWNPFFSFFRNPLRDIQDALLYTKHSLWKFGKNYIRAFKEISKNGKYWQEAKSAGITSSSVYGINEGIDYKKQGVTAEGKRIIQKTESLSNAIEMAPRLAEYISARESGLSIEEALLQAQDVTTNFGRGGTFAKTLNRTIAPFLNPSIQGFSKMWRSYFTKELGTKGWIALIIKSIILGVGLTALNDLLNDDDEEYQNLSDYVKEQNYVLGDGHGNFLKLPKGRVASVFGGVFLRGKSSLQGNEDAWKGYAESVLSAVTPAEQITRNIFSPINDVQTNTAWHGGTIESAKWEDTAPKYRYDETTSKISIWLGDKFNYSPIKINYLIDQYTGVIGDVLLPMTSTQASSGLLEQNILANSTTNSKWSTKYYDTIEKYTFKGTAGDLKAKGVVRYLNCVSNDLKKLREDKAKIQQSTTKSDKEKLAEVKVIQTEINALMAKVLNNVDFAYNQFSKVDLTDEDAYNQMYRDIVAVTMGSKYAIKGYSTKVYEKAVKINDLGIDYDTYYDFYFGALGIEGDKDKNGETISGTKKKKLMQYIWSQDISTTQKLILLMSRGYSVADGEVRGMTARKAKMTVAKYISSLNVSKDYKKELAEMLGFTVKNGKILYN